MQRWYKAILRSRQPEIKQSGPHSDKFFYIKNFFRPDHDLGFMKRNNENLEEQRR